MKRSNVKNTSKKGKSNPTNILEYLFFYDVDCSNAEEVKKRWNIIRKVVLIVLFVLIVFFCFKIFFTKTSS